MAKHPADVLTADNRVRVLRKRCSTCVFRAEGRELFGPERVDELTDRNVAAGALLTCHSTLPYGPYPEFGPAVCAGFWARHGMKTAAGRMARFVLGVVRPMPPGPEGGA